MFKKTVLVLLAVFTIAAVAGDAPDAKDQAKKPCCAEKVSAETTENLQTMCPVMGGEMNKDIFVDHEGSRIYLCCESCKETFSKDPETYLKKMSDAGVVLQKTPCCDKESCKGCKDCKKQGDKETQKT